MGRRGTYTRLECFIGPLRSKRPTEPAKQLNSKQDGDEHTAAAAALATMASFRFLCQKHGDPCLYCVCRQPYEQGGGMIECARCKVGPSVVVWFVLCGSLTDNE